MKTVENLEQILEERSKPGIGMRLLTFWFLLWGIVGAIKSIIWLVRWIIE